MKKLRQSEFKYAFEAPNEALLIKKFSLNTKKKFGGNRSSSTSKKSACKAVEYSLLATNLQDVIQFQYDLSGDEEESKRGHDAKRRHEEEVDTTSLETSRKKLRKFSVPFANAQPDLKK